jgi:hypothetical protein
VYVSVRERENGGVVECVCVAGAGSMGRRMMMREGGE